MSKKFIAICLLSFCVAIGFSENSFAIEKGKSQYLKDIKALTECIYHEGRGEDDLGRFAIGLVVLSRVNSKRFPNTFSEVVYQRNSKNVYQFSFNSRRSKLMNDVTSLIECREIAKFIIDNRESVVLKRLLKGADHYYSTSIAPPYWTKSMKFVKKIGNHKFYKQ